MERYKLLSAGIIKSLIFGCSFLITARAMQLVGIIDLLSMRYLIAFAVFEILRITVFKFKISIRDFISMLPLAIFMPVGYYIFEAIGIKGASSMAAGIMVSFEPVLILIIEILFLKEKTDIKKAFFILTSVAGVVIITLFSGISEEKSTLIGIIFLFFAVLSEALYTVISGKMSKTFSSAQRTYMMMATGAIVFNLINIIRRAHTGDFYSYFAPLLNISSLIYILYMAVFPSVIAFFMYNYMLEREKPSVVSVYLGLETVISIFAGIMFNSEKLFLYHIFGTIMILIGVIGVNKDETNSNNKNRI